MLFISKQQIEKLYRNYKCKKQIQFKPQGATSPIYEDKQ